MIPDPTNPPAAQGDVVLSLHCEHGKVMDICPYCNTTAHPPIEPHAPTPAATVANACDELLKQDSATFAETFKAAEAAVGSTPAAVAQWRALGVGDVVQEGDEISTTNGATWRPVAFTYGFAITETAIWKYRRPLEALASPRAATAAGETVNEPLVKHPEDVCQKCAGDNVVWFTENEIWNAVVGESGILCPSCFVQLADAKGYCKGAWKLIPEPADAGTEDGIPRAEVVRICDGLLLQLNKLKNL